jgi:hypothetical protein
LEELTAEAGFSDADFDEAARKEKIRKSVLSDIERANGFYESKVEPVFRERLQLYEADKDHYQKRFPFLSKQSDFVTHDLWSLIQWAIPSLMNSFVNGGDAIVIVGRKSEDVQRAEVFKSLIDFQLMVQNQGFLTLWDWFTDAFVYNLGVVKCSWLREEEQEENTLFEVDPLRLSALVQSGAQITEMGPPDSLTGAPEWVKYVVPVVKENRPKVESVRVTEIRWSPEARSFSDANFLAHRRLVSADHLRRNAVSRGGMYDDTAVERAIEKGRSDGLKLTEFENELNRELADTLNDADNPARQLYELYECYAKIDIDGDGILDDAIVTVVGEELLRVERNPWGRAPLFAISPIRDPYKVVANMSFSEIVGELQDLKTALLRQIFINTANTNDQRFFVDESRIRISDLIEGRKHIRLLPGNEPGSAVMPFPQQGIASWTMTLLEYLEAVNEQWTGQTRYNQGMDSKSLNKTATGISLLTEASEKRMDYIVRVFAETGVGELLRFMILLNQMYVDQVQVVRLNNTFLEVTPEDLRGEYDIDVNTEAGIGKKKQNIQNLQFYLSAIAPLGMQIGAVTPANWAKAAQKLLFESGIRDPQEYVVDPAILQQQQALQMMMALAAGQPPGGAAPEEGGEKKRPYTRSAT